MHTNRRTFLADFGMGFTGLALGAMLHKDGVARAAAPPAAAPKARAKSVIWIFLSGGVSHLETFDPKPALNKYAGKTIAETPFKDTQDPDKLNKNNRVVVVNDANGQARTTLYPLQVGYKKHGKSGIEVSDWLPHTAACVDDLAVIRSLW